MFTQTVEYALRIAVSLAENDPRPLTADDLSRMTRVPRAYLAKVIQAMVRGGVARSKRGVGGGVSLAQPPTELTLLDVINSVDPIKRAENHPVSENDQSAALAGLHQEFEKALTALESAFGRRSLKEVVAEGADIAPPSASGIPPRESEGGGAPTTLEYGSSGNGTAKAGVASTASVSRGPNEANEHDRHGERPRATESSLS